MELLTIYIVGCVMSLVICYVITESPDIPGVERPDEQTIFWGNLILILLSWLHVLYFMWGFMKANEEEEEE